MRGSVSGLYARGGALFRAPSGAGHAAHAPPTTQVRGRPTHRLASRMSRFIVVMVGSLNASPSSIMYLLRHIIKRAGSQKRR